MAAAGRRCAGALGEGCRRQELRRHREIRMRVLVLGAGGQVGRAVAQSVPAGHEVIARTRADVDIGDASAVGRAIPEAAADWVVNAGAYTAVDQAEDEPAKAAAINDAA